MKKVRRDNDLVVIVNKKTYTPAQFLDVAELMLNERAVVRENGKTLMRGPVWKILLMLDPEVMKMGRKRKRKENKVIESFDNAIWPLFDEVERGKSPLSEFEKIVEGRR